MCKRWQNAGYKTSHTYDLVELRKVLGLENELKDFRNFEKKVLQKAKKDINAIDEQSKKTTDMIFDYEKDNKGKRGVRVKAITFKWEFIKSSKKQWKE